MFVPLPMLCCTRMSLQSKAKDLSFHNDRETFIYSKYGSSNDKSKIHPGITISPFCHISNISEFYLAGELSPPHTHFFIGYTGGVRNKIL